MSLNDGFLEQQKKYADETWDRTMENVKAGKVNITQVLKAMELRNMIDQEIINENRKDLL